MVKRKITKGDPKEKIRLPRRKKVKANLNDLDDAIVDGKLIVPIKGRVYFERLNGSQVEIHAGFIDKVEESGEVYVWDETKEQHFVFSLKVSLLPVIKVIP